jgi:PAS domain-containing protein
MNGHTMAFSIARDISDHVKISKELSEKEQRYRQAVENSPNPIFSVDIKGRILQWNKACEEIFKYNSNKIIGSPYLLF